MDKETPKAVSADWCCLSEVWVHDEQCQCVMSKSVGKKYLGKPPYSDETNPSHPIYGHSLNYGCGRGMISKKI